MSDSRELRTVVDAMSDRPWAHSEPHGFIVSAQHEVGVAETYPYENNSNNANGIIAIVNCADAFVGLVAECEQILGGYPVCDDHEECLCWRCGLRRALARVYSAA